MTAPMVLTSAQLRDDIPALAAQGFFNDPDVVQAWAAQLADTFAAMEEALEQIAAADDHVDGRRVFRTPPPPGPEVTAVRDVRTRRLFVFTQDRSHLRVEPGGGFMHWKSLMGGGSQFVDATGEEPDHA